MFINDGYIRLVIERDGLAAEEGRARGRDSAGIEHETRETYGVGAIVMRATLGGVTHGYVPGRAGRIVTDGEEQKLVIVGGDVDAVARTQRERASHGGRNGYAPVTAEGNVRAAGVL